MVRKCVSWVCQNQWFQVPFLLLPFASVHLERGPNSSVELKRMRPRKKKRKAKRRNICFCAKLHDSPAHFSGTESRIISARELSLQTQPLHDQNTKRDPIMAVKYMPSRKKGIEKNCLAMQKSETLRGTSVTPPIEALFIMQIKLRRFSSLEAKKTSGFFPVALVLFIY